MRKKKIDSRERLCDLRYVRICKFFDRIFDNLYISSNGQYSRCKLSINESCLSVTVIETLQVCTEFKVSDSGRTRIKLKGTQFNRIRIICYALEHSELNPNPER